jgi:outer membrane protein TolC
MKLTPFALTTIFALCTHASPAAAQQTTAGRAAGVPLSALQQAAIEADPRFGALQLQLSQTELRLRTIETERLPATTFGAQAQYQSDVPTAPQLLPGGQPLFAPSKDTYDAYLRIDQRLLDPTIQPRLAAERAQLAETQARTRAALFGLRQEVNDAFFSAALLQERLETLAVTIADLEGRLRETAARVREGTALPSEAAAVEALLLQRQQDAGEVRANRRAAMARLSRLTGRALTDADPLEVPQLGTAVTLARDKADSTRTRPEYEQFVRTQERLARQQDVATAQEQPRLSAFARVGYGLPGLNFINDQFQTYGLAGIHLEWKAWTWGAADRERQTLTLQQQIVAADEAAFTRALGRSTENDLAAIDRLQDALALDDRIITLREQIERSTELRFQEGVVTAADYLDRNTELLEAQLARSRHRVELAQASAKFLTTLGLEVR